MLNKLSTILFSFLGVTEGVGGGRVWMVVDCVRRALTLLLHAIFITSIVTKWIKKGSNMRYTKHKC